MIGLRLRDLGLAVLITVPAALILIVLGFGLAAICEDLLGAEPPPPGATCRCSVDES